MFLVYMKKNAIFNGSLDDVSFQLVQNVGERSHFTIV